MNESIIVYASVNSVGTVEKGKTSKPEREGKLIPQISNSANKSMRRFIFSASPLFELYRVMPWFSLKGLHNNKQSSSVLCQKNFLVDQEPSGL